MDMTQKCFLLLLFASLETLAVQIYNCANNKVEIFEDALVPVTCGGILSTREVRWRRGDEVIIGECRADGTSCTNNLYNDYSLSRSPQSTESRLTLLPEYRRHAGGTVSCAEIDGVSTAICTLVIRRHPVLGQCYVTTDTESGSVSGSCRVQGAYSSDNDYSCRWTVNNQQSFGGFDSARETCSFTQPLPQDSGLYTYTIAVFPPATAGFSQTVTIITVKTTSSRTVSSSVSPGPTQSDNVTTSTSASSTSASAPDIPLDTKWIIVGVVIAVAFIAIIITAICVAVNRRKLECLVLRQKGGDVQVTPSADDAVSDTEVNVREINLVTNSGQPQMSNDENSQSAVYENSERLPDKTYDSTCLPYEEHRYSGLQVRTTGSANTATGRDKTYDSTSLPYEEHRYSGLQVRTTGSANTATGRDVPDCKRKDKTYYNLS